ncbi:MAG: dTMP kinase [Candidatus Hodarchaeales archaeon]
MSYLRKGLLISFEGIDGSGKTTQINKLQNYLKENGYSYSLFYEPTHGEWGLKSRELFRKGHVVPAKEEMMFFVNDRKEDVENNIQPALNTGKIILMDRYYDSNVAYQGALGVAVDEILKANAFAPEPDLTFLFVVSEETATTRIKQQRIEGLNHFEESNYLKKVQDIYIELADRFPERMKKIMTRDNPEKVFKEVLALIQPFLQKYDNRIESN